MPKQNIAENKVLYNQLKGMESFIYERLNEDAASIVLINSKWLENKIAVHLGRTEQTSSTSLLNQIQFFIDNANIREIENGKLGLSQGTIANYKSFKKLISEFEIYSKRQIHFQDLNKGLLNKLKLWLICDKRFSANYVGKNLRMLKTVLNDAAAYGKVIPGDIHRIKTIKEQDKDRHIQTLDFEELRIIYETPMPKKVLEDAKKWLLIGCYIGQRKSDLLRITPQDIRQTAKGVFIDIVQKKTGKHITVAIVEPYVLDIILNDFPNSVSDHGLGRYFREVCKIAGINKEVQGYKILLDENTKLRRKGFGTYPKYEVITSHCCRRSFSTNFYKKMPTAILIGITGHGTEDMFLKYINQQVDKDDNAALFMQYYKQMTVSIKPHTMALEKAE